jgi:ubiquitin C-terminal hydrolase
MDSGHYIADVRSAQDGVWRSYDDSVVTEVRGGAVMRSFSDV